MATREPGPLFYQPVFNVGIELIGEDAHNSICEHTKPHGPEKEYYTGFKKKTSNIPPDNDTVEVHPVKCLRSA